MSNSISPEYAVKTWVYLPVFLTSLLSGAAIYLFFALNSQMVSKYAADYPFLLGLGSIIPAWMTANSKSRYDWLSFLIGLIFTPVALFLIFIISFPIGLPGTDWVTPDLTYPFLAFPIFLALIIIVRDYRLTRPLIIFSVGAFFLTVLAVQIVTRSLISTEIESVFRNGGCVKLNGQTVKSGSAINLGWLIGSTSPRFRFIYANHSVYSWSYAGLKLFLTRETVDDVVKACH